MALSRLLLPKTRFHFHTRGLPKPTRWFSSSSNGKTEKSSCSKKSQAAKEQRAVAVESYVKKYMEMHPGVFPKATQVQNEVGGSWYILKGILADLKGKMLGNPQFQNHFTNETSDSTVDTGASEVTTTHNSPLNTEPKSIVFHSSEAEFDSHRNEKIISTSATFHIMGETSSEDVINTTASEVSKTHNNSDNTDLGETESIVQSSEAIMGSQSNEENISTSAPSQLMGENSAEDMDRSKDISDSSKLVEPENGHRKPEEAMSGLLGGFDRDQKSESEHFFCVTRQLLSEASTTLEKDGANKLTSVGNENRQSDKKITTSGQTPTAHTEVGEMHAPSGSAQKVKGLADMFLRTMNDQAAIKMVGKKNGISTPNRASEYLNETSGEDVAKSHSIKDLITCIKEMPREQSINKSQDNIISNKTDQFSNRGSVRTILSRANLQKIDDKPRQTSLKDHAMGKESKKFNDGKEDPSTEVSFMEYTKFMSKDGDSDSSVVSFDHIKSEPSPQVPLPTSKEHPKKTPDTFFTEKGANQNKVLVRFLNKYVKYGDIASALKDCGPIVIKGSNFKDAYTREGLQKALKKTDLRVKNADAIVEATSSLEDIPNRISIPNLIGDPNVPVALVKNPTRTIMIKQLTHGISPRHLKAALSFCGSGISGIFMGSSSSVAYVEIETEDAKEKAIAKHSIYVLGERLLIFRIDAPRTTVVRISFINFPKMRREVGCILTSYGQVKNITQRKKDIMDVQFKLAEWPNMLNILNSLNGMEVDGCQWLAQPAPVFPPEILRILWSRSDERRRVKAVMHNLFRKFEENPVDTTGLTDLVAKYYGEGF